jgi:hypothetical protein
LTLRLDESPYHGACHKIQIFTIEGLLSGTELARYPDLMRSGFVKSAQVKEKDGD